MNTLKMSFKKDDHQVDVDTYINTLKSLSIVAKEVNQEINKTSDIQLKVVAQKEGSFESFIEFCIVAGPIILELAQTVLPIIQTTLELYKLKHFNNDGDFIEVNQIEDNKVQVRNNRGSIIVNNYTYNIYNNNQPVQDAMASTFSKLSDDDSINGFELDCEGENVAVNKESFPGMSKKAIIAPENVEEELKSAILVLVSPILKDCSNKWDFMYNATPIKANIEDKDFISRMLDHDIQFSVGDRMHVDLLVKNEYDKQLMMFLPKSYTVLKVKNHISGKEAEQMRLV